MNLALSVAKSVWFIGVVAVGWVVLTGTLAITDPSSTLTALLMAWAIIVTIVATGALHLNQRVFDQSLSTLKGWEEQEALTLDLTHLLGETLDHLSTWDRETSDEIADRTNTVIRLRFQNFSERNHP